MKRLSDRKSALNTIPYIIGLKYVETYRHYSKEKMEHKAIHLLAPRGVSKIGVQVVVRDIHAPT